MKYQIGDTVLILHSNEEAVVRDIMGQDMLLVDVNGVSFPVYMDQVDFPYFKRFTEKKPLARPKEKQYIDDLRREKRLEQEQVVDGLWLTFLPVMDTDAFGDLVVEELKLHLVNHTPLAYVFTYQLTFFGKTDLTLTNTIRPFQDFYLQDIPFADLNDSPAFEFEFTLAEPDRKKADRHPVSVRLKPKQLFSRIETLRKNNAATFSQLLFLTYPDRVVEEPVTLGDRARSGAPVYDASAARQYLEPARTVVDLHIDKITDDWKQLSSYEILNLQLQAFEKYYHLALVHHQPSLIVIHGVGEGVLRDQVHQVLRTKKEVQSFVNQYHPSFGFGATEIYFRY